jgi:hypothetical protein
MPKDSERVAEVYGSTRALPDGEMRAAEDALAEEITGSQFVLDVARMVRVAEDRNVPSPRPEVGGSEGRERSITCGCAGCGPNPNRRAEEEDADAGASPTVSSHSDIVTWEPGALADTVRSERRQGG